MGVRLRCEEEGGAVRKIFLSALYLLILPTYSVYLFRAEIPSQIFHQHIMTGIDSIYNFNFRAADSIFRQLIRNDSASYLGYFYLAMIEWNKNQICNRDNRIVRRGLRLLDSVEIVCKNKLKDDPGNEADYLFYMAGAVGYKGIFYLLQGNYIQAGLKGKKGHHLFEEYLRKYPYRADVYLGLGIYDYYADLVPFYIKFLRMLLALPPGNRRKGLQEIWHCAQYGDLAKTEALQMYAYLQWYYEHRYKESLPITQKLWRKYPNNLIFLGRLIEIYFQLHQLNKVDSLEKIFVQKQQLFQQRYPDICLDSFIFYEISYDFGYIHFHKGNYQKALKYLRHYIETLTVDSPAEKIAHSYLMLGQIYDVIGMREKARENYQNVLKLKGFKELKKQARLYLQEPYRP